MNLVSKLSENQVILLLIAFLREQGWHIADDGYRLGHAHGVDILAVKDQQKLYIEAKGARAGDESLNRKREKFDSGQIKTHFGKAIVKVLQDKAFNNEGLFAIAHPDDPDIRRAIGHLLPFLKQLDIRHYWVTKEKISEEY